MKGMKIRLNEFISRKLKMNKRLYYYIDLYKSSN